MFFPLISNVVIKPGLKDAYFKDKFFVDAISATGAYGRVQSVDNWGEDITNFLSVKSWFLNSDYSDNNNMLMKRRKTLISTMVMKSITLTRMMKRAARFSVRGQVCVGLHLQSGRQSMFVIVFNAALLFFAKIQSLMF